MGGASVPTPALYPAFFFVLEKAVEKRRKRSHTNVSNASVTFRIFKRVTTPSCHHGNWLPSLHGFAFTRRKWVHTRLSEKDRTQRLTRRNRGVSDGGAITTLGAFRTFTNIPGPGVRTANFAALGSWPGVLPKNAESLRNSDALMRVAVPKASRPRWAA